MPKAKTNVAGRAAQRTHTRSNGDLHTPTYNIIIILCVLCEETRWNEMSSTSSSSTKGMFSACCKCFTSALRASLKAQTHTHARKCRVRPWSNSRPVFYGTATTIYLLAEAPGKNPKNSLRWTLPMNMFKMDRKILLSSLPPPSPLRAINRRWWYQMWHFHYHNTFRQWMPPPSLPHILSKC